MRAKCFAWFTPQSRLRASCRIDSIRPEVLSEHGVRAVLSLLRNAVAVEGVDAHLRVEIDDLPEEDLLSELPRCMDFIYENAQKGPVLVHWCGYMLGGVPACCVCMAGTYEPTWRVCVCVWWVRMYGCVRVLWRACCVRVYGCAHVVHL